MSTTEPTLRWGIIATGLISSWFVADLTLSRANAQAKHIIQAIGSSSREKGKAFVDQHLPGTSPTIYGSYEEVYADPNVDIVYIGTPHAFHRQNCLDAISHGKHVLCEKAFTLNATEAREVFAAAEKKGVFIMEALWTRFFPLTRTLQSMLHSDKVIGDISRVFCDFAMKQDITSRPADSRLRNRALGAGSLLDVGVYSLTWGLLALDPHIGTEAQTPKMVAVQQLVDGIDVASSMLLLYPEGKQGILTSSTLGKTASEFCRIEGSKGTIFIEGIASSVPSSFALVVPGEDPKKFEFERPGKGFYWEADAVALDIAAGRKQSSVMPWAETIRVLDLLDEVRRQGGAVFPQEEAR